jgi:hypothetical protein
MADSHQRKRYPAVAEDLLHTFLKARFGDRVEIFEEVGTGAGRLDLYVKLEGGLVSEKQSVRALAQTVDRPD